MNDFSKYYEILDEHSPVPVNMPKIYFLGDTGAGKTTIIRKLLGTDGFNFPTTRQTRTTVAITEYVISKNLPFKATFIFKTEEQIKGYIKEIVQEAAYKAYKEKQNRKEKVAKYLRQTNDQSFRLYYIVSDHALLEIAEQIIGMFPKIDDKIGQLRLEFPDDTDEIETFIDLALDDLKNIDQIAQKVFTQVQEIVTEFCDGYDLCSNIRYYQFSEEKQKFITRCKTLLASEKNSISPVIDYARIQGFLLADWINEETEVILIDGQGIGHDTREASQLSPRHYDHFYKSDAIILVEESKKPFIASGKSALKSIFERGYGEKLLIIFSKLDEVKLYDIDDPSREDRIDEVNDSLENVISALKGERVEINLDNDNLFYLSGVNEPQLDEDTLNQILSIMKKSNELSSFKAIFITPEYDFEMLSAYLRESTKQFIKLYETLLSRQHWQTVKAFNRRMTWGVDGFRMFAPIADFEEKINDEVKEFITHPKGWTKEITEKLKIESINQIKREFNQLILTFAREIIINSPNTDWQESLSFYGAGSTFVRRSKIEKILKNSVPSDIATDNATIFKSKIKEIVVKAIENSERSA